MYGKGDKVYFLKLVIGSNACNEIILNNYLPNIFKL